VCYIGTQITPQEGWSSGSGVNERGYPECLCPQKRANQGCHCWKWPGEGPGERPSPTPSITPHSRRKGRLLARREATDPQLLR